MIKCVLFDVDGVLIDSFEANLKFYQDLLSKNGYNPPTREAYSSMHHMPMTDVIRVVTKSEDEKEVVRIWEMARDRIVPYPYNLLAYPQQYESVLEELRKKYILGIVTSRIRGGVFRLPQLAKFEEYFKTAVYYEDTVKHKPHPDPLLLAANRLNIKPGEAVYIGDMATDVEAAKAAGMKVIIYSKKSLPKADINTSEFTKLPDLVKSLN